MRISWILGWAVPAGWFAPLAQAAFPDAENHFLAAEPNWLEHLRAGGPWDAVAGYSLGSLLLLQEAAAVRQVTPRVVLLAPVLAFAQEEALGGKVPRTQVRYLARWVRRDPVAALADFYTRAGLLGCEKAGPLVSAEELQWGLDKLAQDRCDAPWPQGWTGYVGDEDALLDAAVLVRMQPGLNAVTGASHHPQALMHAWARDC